MKISDKAWDEILCFNNPYENLTASWESEHLIRAQETHMKFEWKRHEIWMEAMSSAQYGKTKSTKTTFHVGMLSAATAKNESLMIAYSNI